MSTFRRALIAAATTILAAGCTPRQRSDNGVGEEPARLDESRFFDTAFRVANLTIWPILADRFQELGEFLTLSDAQATGAAVVKEMAIEPPPPLVPAPSFAYVSFNLPQSSQEPGQESDAPAEDGAEVHSITIENSGGLPILVCAGTIVKGGRQDRQIGQDVVIAPGSSASVEAFCIEERRWEPMRNGVDTAGIFVPLPVLAAKDVRASAQYERDQRSVWASVEACNNAAGKSPRTSTLLAAVEEVDAAAIARRAETEHGIRAHFAQLRADGKNAVGFAYAINGRPISVRTFASPGLLDGQIESFAKTMCIEADLARGDAAGELAPIPAGSGGRIEDVLALVRRIDGAPEATVSTGAASTLGVRRSAAGGNSNCYLPAASASGQRLRVTQDWTSAR